MGKLFTKQEIQDRVGEIIKKCIKLEKGYMDSGAHEFASKSELLDGIKAIEEMCHEIQGGI